MGYITLDQTEGDIVELVLDQPGQSVNTMGQEYLDAMTEAVAELKARVSAGLVSGVYIRSGKETFFGGGDLKALLEGPTELTAEEATQRLEGILEVKRIFRTLESMGVPVVVGINGAALGGGYEICLASHYRIALNKPGVEVGLPEAQLGLMPGAGGVVRMVRKFGVQQAITWISQGKSFKAEQALEAGWIDALAEDEADMRAQAREWIAMHPGYKQPWDQPGYQIPGGSPADKLLSQELEGLLYFGPINVVNSSNNNFPAPKVIFACAAETARVDFDTAERIEARYFLQLMTSQVAKNMINTFFFQLNDIKKGGRRPTQVPPLSIRTIGVLGAGQMGAGIALCAAQSGIHVILKDLSLANAERGKGYAASLCEKNKRLGESERLEILARIKPSEDDVDLAECELVIEAVFEDRAIKAAVTRATEAATSTDCIFASNTSALPITELAQASTRPKNFIGMHFFSPAEKMPLVEIICGKETGDEALAAAFDLALAMKKTPIVVNDAPGFFTTRVIGTTISEGAQMVTEGIDPVLIEAAAKRNGSPVGPLAAIDEISQETAYKNGQQAKADAEAQGISIADNPTSQLIDKMVNDWGRLGKVHGAGYYDYPSDGKKRIWPGLKAHFAPNGCVDIPFQDICDRLIYCQSLEAVKTLEEGVLTAVADGNVGSIFGIGFPANSGGVFQFINATGLSRFVDRADELADRYGERFRPSDGLRQRAVDGQVFV